MPRESARLNKSRASSFLIFPRWASTVPCKLRRCINREYCAETECFCFSCCGRSMYKGVNPTPRNWALVTTASGRLRVCDSGGRVIAGKWTQMRIGKTKNGHVDDHPKRGIVDWVLATPHHLSQTSPQKAAGSYCVFSTVGVGTDTVNLTLMSV